MLKRSRALRPALLKALLDIDPRVSHFRLRFRAIFAVRKAVPVQVVGGLSIAQAKRLAKAGLRAFVISGNMGLPDGNARYNLPPAEIQRLVAGFIAEVSGG